MHLFGYPGPHDNNIKSGKKRKKQMMEESKDKIGRLNIPLLRLAERDT